MKITVNKLSIPVLISGMLIHSGAMAADANDLRLTGFVTAGASQVSGDVIEYLERFEDGEIEYSNTRIGLNASAKVSDEISVAGQILMAGREDEYNAHADWVFVTYSPKAFKNTAVKIGRIKFPTLINSEIYDVAYAYPWVSAPQEIYDLSALGSQASYEVISGANLSYGSYFGDYDWKVQAFGGEADSGLGTIDNLFGAVFSVNNDIVELRVGWHEGKLTGGDGGHAEGLVGEIAEHKGEKLLNANKNVLNFGMNLTLDNIIVLAEYVSVDWSGGQEQAETNAFDTDSYYITAGYQMGKWMPLITIAEMDEKGGTNQQTLTLGLRHEISRSTAVKLEWQSIDIKGRADPLHIENELGEEFFQSGLAILSEDGTENKLSMINFSIDVVF